MSSTWFIFVSDCLPFFTHMTLMYCAEVASGWYSAIFHNRLKSTVSPVFFQKSQMSLNSCKVVAVASAVSICLASATEMNYVRNLHRNSFFIYDLEVFPILSHAVVGVSPSVVVATRRAWTFTTILWTYVCWLDKVWSSRSCLSSRTWGEHFQ